MKLEIEPKPKASTILNLAKFKSEYCKSFNLHKALEKSLKIVETAFEKQHTIDVVIHGINWGEVLTYIDKTNSNEIKFNVHMVEYSDWVKVYPKIIKGNKVEMDNKTESGKTVLVMTDLVYRTEFSINMMIQNQTFCDYYKDFSRCTV